MKMYYRATLLPLASALLLAACSGSGTSYGPNNSINNKGGDINGYVGASNISRAKIYAVPTDEQGQPARTEKGDAYEGATPVHSSARKDASFASFSQTYASENKAKAMVLIANAVAGKTEQRCELVGGCNNGVDYKGSIAIAETTNDEGSFKLTAGIPRAEENLTVNINWITTLAADIAYTTYHDVDSDNWGTISDPINAAQNPGSGMFTAFTIEKGNLWLAKQLNLPSVTTIQPIAPSALSGLQNSAAGELKEGIYYGALLAAGQKLAVDQGITEAEWLSKVINQQRNLLGQLYYNSDNKFSLCALYTAAENVLDSNIKQQSGVPAAANDALAKIGDAKTVSCAKGNNDVTNIDVAPEAAWQDRFVLAEEFLTDLDQRLGNFKGEATGTCESWSPSPSATGCTASFYDPKVVKRTSEYFNDTFQPVIDQAIKKALPDIIKGVLEFTHDGITDDGATFETEHGLTLTLNLKTSVKAEGSTDKYNAFDFEIRGTQTFNGYKLEYKPRKGTNSVGTEIEEISRLRVVYDTAHQLPPATKVEDASLISTPDANAVEPLGFDLQLVKVELPNQGQGGKGLTFMSQMKMIGVKPIYAANQHFHYNFTEIDFNFGDVVGEVTSGDYLGELRHTDIIFSARSTNAANYYSESVWPEEKDFFDFSKAPEVGDTVAKTIPGLFTYTLKKNVDVVYQVKCSGGTDEDGKCAGDLEAIEKKADYFQLLTKNLGANRFELFTEDGKQTLRKCSVQVDENNEPVDGDAEINKVCTAEESVRGEQQEDGSYLPYDLLTDLLNGSERDSISSFAIPGYGLYEVQFTKDGNGNITADDSQTVVAGERIAGFRQGIDRMSLQITQALDDSINADGTAERKPSTITKVNFNKQTNNDWEVALSTGYNFDYIIGPLPTGVGGKATQSLYTSYYIKDAQTDDSENEQRYVTELSSLQVFRGGVSLSGKDATSYSATAGKVFGYYIDDDDKIVACSSGLAITNKCREDAIAYLSFQGYLLGIIREERDGQYVARLSNGKAIELSNLSSFDYRDTLPVKMPFVGN